MALAVTHEAARKLVRRDLSELAPKFQTSIKIAAARCAQEGAPVYIYEVLRTHELAAMYYQLGSSKARNGFRTWHFYGLAVDVVHPTKYWSAWPEWNVRLRKWQGGDIIWWEKVVRIFKENNCDWGGDWTSFKDTPHFQWHLCKPSPSDMAIELYNSGGRQAVWNAVRAA